MRDVISLWGFQFRPAVMERVRGDVGALSVFEKAAENHRLRRAPDNGNRYLDTLELAAATVARQREAQRAQQGPLRAFFALTPWHQAAAIMGGHVSDEVEASMVATTIARDQLPKAAGQALAKLERQQYLHGTRYGMGPAEPDTPENRWSFKFDSASVVEVDGVVVGYCIELIQTMTATGEVPPYPEGGQLALDVHGRYLDQDTPGYPL